MAFRIMLRQPLHRLSRRAKQSRKNASVMMLLPFMFLFQC